MESSLATIQTLIEEAKAGRMFILIDEESRENEGDLVLPAAKVTPQAINFMATYGKGLICLAMEGKEIDRLNLPLMVKHNTAPLNTAFTVSIDAKNGITTGISTTDRAYTIKVATDPESSGQDLVTPGHIFPLRACKGGTLERSGHTEASVDIIKLAGLSGAAVICEILNEDGSMARYPELMHFAKKHHLEMGKISDLVRHLRHQKRAI